VNEVRAYLVTLGLLTVLGATYVWLAEPPIPPPPEIDTTRAAPAIADALEEAHQEAVTAASSASARGHLGMLCYAHEFRHEALECFQQAVRLEPRQFRWHYYLAIVKEDFNLVEAADSYRNAMRYRPNYPPLYMRLATLLVRLNRPDEARRNYQLAAELDPKSPHPLLGLARLEMSQGRLAEAELLLDRVAEIAPPSRDATIEKIRLLRMKGDLIAAARLEESISLAPPSATGMPDEFLTEMEQMDLSSNRLARNADTLLAQDRFDEAAELLMRLILDRPELARLRITLGQIRMRQQNLRAATQIFTEAVQQFPNDPTCRFALGTAFESAKAWKPAAQAYAEAARLKPDYSEALYRHGRVLVQLQRPEEAIAPLQACLAVDPVHSRARAELIRLLRNLNRQSEALALAEETVQIFPKDPEALELLHELSPNAK